MVAMAGLSSAETMKLFGEGPWGERADRGGGGGASGRTGIAPGQRSPTYSGEGWLTTCAWLPTIVAYSAQQPASPDERHDP